jgi:integrase
MFLTPSVPLFSIQWRPAPLNYHTSNAEPSFYVIDGNPSMTRRRFWVGGMKSGRKHLTTGRERLMDAAKGNRWGPRDATMILVAYRHGLRASEVADLRWDQIDFRSATLHVRRVKQGTPSTHPILGDELRALRRLQREQQPKSPFVFTSERGAPFSPAGFARMVERAGAEAKFPFKAHPHMLRHACGYKLANDGHDTRALQAYLGHKNIQHTVRYTELAPMRFKDFWRK